MENKLEKYTLITGASSGIGKAMAYECARRKMNLLLIALPETGLVSVCDDIIENHHVGVNYLEINLCEQTGPQKVFDWCEKNGYQVDFLINNAGKAGTAVFVSSDPEYVDERIMLNVRALALLCRLFLPKLMTFSRAYILNVGSLSAFFPVPFKSVYAASKVFVVQFSKAIRAELKNTGVTVSVVCPNGVRTNSGTNYRIDSHGWAGRVTEMSAEKVAAISIAAALKGKKVIIPGGINRLLLCIQKIIPSGLQEKILIREFNKEVKVS